MFDINMEIEILERCASECALISNLATDRRARVENGELAAGYRLMAAHLKSYAQKRITADSKHNRISITDALTPVLKRKRPQYGGY
jgi:hypothetical protein